MFVALAHLSSFCYFVLPHGEAHKANISISAYAAAITAASESSVSNDDSWVSRHNNPSSDVT